MQALFQCKHVERTYRNQGWIKPPTLTTSSFRHWDDKNTYGGKLNGKDIFCFLSKRNSNDENDYKEQEEEELTIQQKVDKFLDSTFFDPDQVIAEIELEQEQKQKKKRSNAKPEEDSESTEDQEETDTKISKKSNPIARRFALLVKNDYQTAEALFAAGFISLMVILAQELLRSQVYGDAYVPFQQGSTGGFGGRFDGIY